LCDYEMSVGEIVREADRQSDSDSERESLRVRERERKRERERGREGEATGSPGIVSAEDYYGTWRADFAAFDADCSARHANYEARDAAAPRAIASSTPSAPADLRPGAGPSAATRESSPASSGHYSSVRPQDRRRY
jgi:hypothetical protein